MKKYKVVVTLLFSYSLFSAEKGSQSSSGWFSNVLPTQVKQLMHNAVEGVKNTVEEVRNRVQGAPEFVTLDTGDDFEFVATQKNLQDVAGLFHEVQQQALALQVKAGQQRELSRETITTLETSLNSMNDSLQKKDREIAELQRQLHQVQLPTPSSSVEGTDTAGNGDDSDEEKRISQAAKDYKTALQAKKSLEKQLDDLSQQNNELLSQITHFSSNIKQTEQSNRRLRTQADRAQEALAQDDAEYTLLLEENMRELLSLQRQKQIHQEEKEIVIKVLVGILQQGAAAQEVEYNEEFVETFLRALHVLTTSEREILIGILFPAGSDTILI